MELLFKEEAYALFGACFEVYNEMGCGFLPAWLVRTTKPGRSRDSLPRP